MDGSADRWWYRRHQGRGTGRWLRRAACHADAHSNADPDSNADSLTVPDTDAATANSHGDAVGWAYANPQPDANTDAHRHTNPNAGTNACAHSNPNAAANANPNPLPDANAASTAAALRVDPPVHRHRSHARAAAMRTFAHRGRRNPPIRPRRQDWAP